MPDRAVPEGWEVRYMEPATLRQLGLVQEINRTMLHPLGLALEVDDEAGTIRVQDWRDFPEGVTFAVRPDLAAEFVGKHRQVLEICRERHNERFRMLGYVVQTVDDAIAAGAVLEREAARDHDDSGGKP